MPPPTAITTGTAMSPGPAFAKSVFGVVVVVLEVCGVVAGVVVVVPEPEVLDVLPEPDVEPVPVELFPVEESFLSEDDESLEPLEVDSFNEDSVSVVVSSPLLGLRQNSSQSMNQIMPIRTSADTISQIMRPIVDGCRCSYICLTSRVSYPLHNY